MARGVNKVILIGNVGNDPDVAAFPNGDCIVKFSLATSESWKDKTTGELKERTEWHRVVFTNRAAEVLRDHLKKGSKLYVEGSNRTRKYEKEGQTHYTTEVIGRGFQFLGGGQEKDGAAPAQQAGQQSSDPGGAESFDDDIPF